MDVTKLCLLGIGIAVVISLVKSVNSTIARVVTASGIIVLTGLVITLIASIINKVKGWDFLYQGDYITKGVFKAVGISYVTDVSADIIEELASDKIAAKVREYGRLAILALTIPLILKMVEQLNALLAVL